MQWFFNRFRFASRSPDWKKIRKQHLLLQPFCQACGKINDLEVHHIVPVHVDPAKELDLNNLITLCSKQCHLTFGHLMDYKSWNKDVVNDCQSYLKKIQQRPYHERDQKTNPNI